MSFFSSDHDPMTLILKLDLHMIKMYLHNKNEVPSYVHRKEENLSILIINKQIFVRLQLFHESVPFKIHKKQRLVLKTIKTLPRQTHSNSSSESTPSPCVLFMNSQLIHIIESLLHEIENSQSRRDFTNVCFRFCLCVFLKI